MGGDGGPRARHHFGVWYCAIAVYVFIGFNGLAHILLSGLEAVAQDETQHRFRRTAGELRTNPGRSNIPFYLTEKLH